MHPNDRPCRVAALPALLLALAAVSGCEFGQKSLVAPSDAIMSLSASTGFVPANSSATLTIQLKKLDGNPAADGTEIALTASMGELDQRKVRLSNGLATVGYRAGAETGTARITASSGSVSAEIALQVGSAAPGALSLFATPSLLQVGGGQTEIVATVTSPSGQVVTNAPVVFSTNVGTLSATAVNSDGRGEAKTVLQTTATATVRARVGTLEAEPLTVRVRTGVLINVSFSPAAPVAGQVVTITVSPRTPDGQPITGRVRLLFGDGQQRDLGSVSGTSTATYTYATQGGYNLTAEFTDQDGFVDRETVRVNVQAPSAPAPPTTPTPPPTTPGPSPGPGAGDELDLRQVTFLHRDISRWPVTSTITNVRITPSEICVDHTGAGRFPTSTFGTIQVEGNVWILAQFGGRWYAATYDWLRIGQTCKGMTARELGVDQIRIAPMDASWPGPRSGETVGFMVSARARDEVRAGEERTNVVLVRWP